MINRLQPFSGVSVATIGATKLDKPAFSRCFRRSTEPKGGLSYGATDDFGYYPVENPVSIRDLQATILHSLGLDPHRFSYAYQGLDNRLIGPTDEGHVLKDILA